MIMMIGSIFAVPTMTVATSQVNIEAEKQSNSFTISGTVEEGDIYYISINEEEYNYTVVSEDTLNTITVALASLVNVNDDVTATVAVDSNIIVTEAVVAGVVYTFESSTDNVQGGVPEQTIEVTSVEKTDEVPATGQVDTIVITNVEEGDTFSISGITGSVIVVASTADVIAVVNEFVTEINGDGSSTVTASNIDDNLVLTANDIGVGFVTTVATVNVFEGTDNQEMDVSSVAKTELVPATPQVDTVIIADIEANDSFTISGVTDTDVTLVTIVDETVTELVDRFVIGINTGVNPIVTATNVEGNLVLTSDVTANGFTTVVSTSDDGIDDQTITEAEINANVVAVAQEDTITFDGLNEEGYVFSISVDSEGVEQIYTNTNIDQDHVDTLNSLLTDLNSEVFGNSYDGSVITIIAEVEGVPFTTTVSVELHTELLGSTVSINGESYVGETLSCDYSEGDYSNSDFTVSWFITPELEGGVTEIGSFQELDLIELYLGHEVYCEVLIQNTDITIRSELSEVTWNEWNNEDVLDYIEISDGVVFSVPTCVNSAEMLSLAGFSVDDETFVTFTNGQWVSFDGEFDLLKGYKYLGDNTFNLPIIAADSCNMEEQQVIVNNGWNLVGVNAEEDIDMGDLLWSMTLGSRTNMFINTVYDFEENIMCGYDIEDGDFYGPQDEAYPTEAYWVFYAGDETFFNGYSGEVVV